MAFGSLAKQYMRQPKACTPRLIFVPAARPLMSFASQQCVRYPKINTVFSALARRSFSSSVRDPYTVLGVPRTATAQELKKAYFAQVWGIMGSRTCTCILEVVLCATQ